MVKKNHAKGESFSYAFIRIKQSIENEYYLEAVTIAESVISDRLLSFVKPKIKKFDITTQFYKLIRAAKKLNTIKLNKKNDMDLFDALDDWRKERNRCVHALAKSEPGYETISVEDFQKMTKKCAIQGKDLARQVCNWHRKAKKINLNTKK